MAALVILGVAASAAQLVEYSTTIVSFIARISNKIRDAPRQYREYEIELKLLIYTARSIGLNPALQTADIQYHLDATLVDVKALQSILCRLAVDFTKSSHWRRYWNVIKGSDERRISLHLESLHRKNTGLLLCISTANTAQLSSVQGSLDKLVDMNAGCDQKSWAEIDAETAIQSAEVDDTCQKPQFLQPSQFFYDSDITALVVRKKQLGLITSTYLAETPIRKRMGHKFGKIKIGARSKVTTGNTTNGCGPNETAIRKGHTYNLIVVGEDSKVHCGDTGHGSLKDHEYVEMEIADSATVYVGDIDSLDTKEQAFAAGKKVEDC